MAHKQLEAEDVLLECKLALQELEAHVESRAPALVAKREDEQLLVRLSPPCMAARRPPTTQLIMMILVRGSITFDAGTRDQFCSILGMNTPTR